MGKDKEPPIMCDCFVDGCRCAEREEARVEQAKLRTELATQSRQLALIRSQFNGWRGGHVFDNGLCLICGNPLSQAPKLCVMEMYLRIFKEQVSS